MNYFIRKNVAGEIRGPLSVDDIALELTGGIISPDWLATGSLGESREQIERQSPNDWFSIMKVAGLEAVKPAQTEASKRLVNCSMCDKQISPAAPTCPQCGHPMKAQEAVQAAAQVQIEQVKRTNYWLKIIGVAILIILFKFVFRWF